MELLLDVNWVAVIVGAVAAFALGWLWYSPKLFGTRWAAEVGIRMEDSGSAALAMIAQGAATFLLAWVIGVTASLNSLPLAVLIGLMVAGLIKANGLFAQKSTYAIITETGYILAMVLIMVAVHAVL